MHVSQMDVCIDAAVLGTEDHLVFSPNRGVTWSPIVPSGMWHVTGGVKPCNDWCFDSLLRLAGCRLPLRPPQRFVAPIETLMSGSIGSTDTNVNPPWRYLMPEREHRAFVKRLLVDLEVSLDKLPFEYFMGTWVPGNSIIKQLQRARVDARERAGILASGEGNVHALETFAPDHTGFAQAVVYDRFGTLTGRPTVESGPNILTLKREHRRIIVPSEPDNVVMMIDFSGLEARVLLYEAGRRCDDRDLYATLAAELGVSRQAAKAAVISELYGSSKHALGAVLKLDGKELNRFIKRVKTHFNTGVLLKRIKQQFVAMGKITNRYGRPVDVDEPLDHIFINYYAQSTGADVALIGFSNLINSANSLGLAVKPLYLLYDALVFEVPVVNVEQFINLASSLHVPGYVQPFLTRAEALG